MKKEIILKIISGLLAALFFYAAFSKLLDYDRSKGEMLNQVFPRSVAELLTWLVPAVELILVLLLIYLPTRLFAFWCSLVLLTGFTLYIAVVMTGIFGRVPCSCGGILENMGYGTHLLFNLFFVALAYLGIWLCKGWAKDNPSWLDLKRRKDIAHHSE